MTRWALLACCLGWLLSAGRALAHAPPIATDIFWIGPDAAPRAVVRTNRGLIFEGAGPKSFSIACNDGFFAGLADVPSVTPRGDGRLLIGTFQAGLVLSSQDHCNYSQVGGPIEGINVIDVARGTGELFYAVVLPLDGSSAQLFESSGGETFRPLAVFSSIPSAIALAAAGAGRVYVSASVATEDANAAVLLVSKDGGHAFVEHPIALDSTELRVLVRAVDPSDPDRVFVRTQSRDGVTPERLLLSEDAGVTFETVLTAAGPIAVHAEDGAVWAGSAGGLYRSTDRGRSFTRIGPEFITHIGCVRRHEGAVYVCGYSESQLAFGVLVSTDEGGSFHWFLEFPQVRARLSCDAQSSEGVFCGGPFDDWSVEQGLAGPAMPSMSNGGSSASSGGTSASSGGMNGATAGVSLDRAGSAGAAGSLAPEPRPGSACALRVPTQRAGGWAQGLAMLGACVAYRRRRCGRHTTRLPSSAIGCARRM